MLPPAGVESSDWLKTAFSPDPTGINSQTSYHRRLGIYYENLVEEIIKSSSQPIDIYRNIKVLENKITLGEFDFIGVINGQHFHLECAIKFYLRVGDGSQLSHFIGPGKKDRLDIKWHRMLEHQLPLSTTGAGIASCRQYQIDPEVRALLLQGYLFHPYSEWQQTMPELHADINPQHLRGWWLRFSKLERINTACAYSIMQKPDWLTADYRTLLSFAELKDYLSAAKGPQLVARFNQAGEESDRGFVVSDDW
ncbi:DUF1853 family protein [Neptuniibacter halophilus]|uniref:DUF1853 family protein n=1 Tax=Neptuniibacter halophilus TaxID=651666 RepID=UPI00257337D6|nr:DUF1853 family protein [Neptuniibacter halophilus]